MSTDASVYLGDATADVAHRAGCEPDAVIYACQLTSPGSAKAREALVCQVPGCNADLSGLRDYHQRYKICEVHVKVDHLLKDGELQRFCQQCGRFQPLGLFDGSKRSCRHRLARHNARRRRKPCEFTSVSLTNLHLAASGPSGISAMEASAGVSRLQSLPNSIVSSRTTTAPSSGTIPKASGFHASCDMPFSNPLYSLQFQQPQADSSFASQLPGSARPAGTSMSTSLLMPALSSYPWDGGFSADTLYHTFPKTLNLPDEPKRRRGISAPLPFNPTAAHQSGTQQLAAVHTTHGAMNHLKVESISENIAAMMPGPQTSHNWGDMVKQTMPGTSNRALGESQSLESIWLEVQNAPSWNDQMRVKPSAGAPHLVSSSSAGLPVEPLDVPQPTRRRSNWQDRTQPDLQPQPQDLKRMHQSRGMACKFDQLVLEPEAKPSPDHVMLQYMTTQSWPDL